MSIPQFTSIEDTINRLAAESILAQSGRDDLPGVAGGAILRDGNIALILDPGSLLNAG